jgi:fumarate reductase flavoprotein subunit
VTEDRTDVVVIGGGLAGLIAAVGAAQSGLRVAVLEQSKDEAYVCNSRLTGGVFHCALRAADTPAGQLEKSIVANRGPDVNHALAHSIAADILPAIRWLQSLGVRFIRASADPWHRFVLAPPSLGRTGEAWRGRGGDVLLRRLEAHLVEAGGTIRRGYRARELVVDGGAVRAVRGDEFLIATRAVVIADGGFQRSADLVRLGISPQPDLLVRRNAGTGWGDGLLMAEAVGAAVVADRAGFYGHVVSRDALVRDDLRFYPWLDELAKHGMAVTSDGRRFCDEGGGGIRLANRIAALPDPGSAFVLWDEAVWQGPAKARFMSANPALDRLGATVHRAQSLRGAAQLAGVDPVGLEREVADYNRALQSDTLNTLEPPRSRRGLTLLPIGTPPFAIAPAAAGMTYTMGGLAVDGCSRVVAKAGGLIGGLYAVGGSSGGVEGGPRAAYVGGLSKASATAWRAARTIVQALEKNELGKVA